MISDYPHLCDAIYETVKNSKLPYTVEELADIFKNLGKVGFLERFLKERKEVKRWK